MLVAGAAVATAALKAFGTVTESKHKHVIDRSKLRRERTKYREDIRLEEDHLFGLVNSIYVNGRKDATMKSNEQNGKYYLETIIEEHYVIVGEPHESYCLMLHLLEEPVCTLRKQYFKLLKEPSYKIHWPLLDQTERQV